MGLQIKNDANASTVREFRYFTGIIPYHVIAINPTMAELHDLGMTHISREPVYQRELKFGDGPVTKRAQIDVWLRSLPLKELGGFSVITKLNFQIDHDIFVGKESGKTQYINKYGRTAWGMTPDHLAQAKFFVNHDARPSHKGEEDLHKFLFAWLNMSYDDKNEKYDECRLNADKIINGDYSELKEVVDTAEQYVVQVLTGVYKKEDEEGKVKYYHNVYNKYFMKHNQKSPEGIASFIEKSDWNAFKYKEDGDIVYTFELKEYIPGTTPDPEPATSETARGGGEDSPF